MLQSVPELNFMRALGGDYRNQRATDHLRIWKCGYGVALETRDARRTRLVGVIGAVGPGGAGVEFFAQAGMPNVLRLVGRHTSATSVRFDCDDLAIALTIAKGADAVRLAIAFEGVEKYAHEFRQESAWAPATARIAVRP